MEFILSYAPVSLLKQDMEKTKGIYHQQLQYQPI